MFPHVKSVLPAMVTGKRPPCIYLDHQWAFPSYLTHWAQKLNHFQGWGPWKFPLMQNLDYTACFRAVRTCKFSCQCFTTQQYSHRYCWWSVIWCSRQPLICSCGQWSNCWCHVRMARYFLCQYFLSQYPHCSSSLFCHVLQRKQEIKWPLLASILTWSMGNCGRLESRWLLGICYLTVHPDVAAGTSDCQIFSLTFSAVWSGQKCRGFLNLRLVWL